MSGSGFLCILLKYLLCGKFSCLVRECVKSRFSVDEDLVGKFEIDWFIKDKDRDDMGSAFKYPVEQMGTADAAESSLGPIRRRVYA